MKLSRVVGRVDDNMLRTVGLTLYTLLWDDSWDTFKTLCNDEP